MFGQLVQHIVPVFQLTLVRWKKLSQNVFLESIMPVVPITKNAGIRVARIRPVTIRNTPPGKAARDFQYIAFYIAEGPSIGTSHCGVTPR